MQEGIVARYSEDKRFGYILTNNNELVIVERDSIDEPGYKTLVPGDRVTFDVEEGIREPVAKNVKKL